MTWPRPPTPVRRWVMNVQGWNKFQPGIGIWGKSWWARSRPAGAMQQINGRGSCHGFTKYLEAEVVTRLWRAAHPVPALRAIRHRPDTGPAPTANGSAEGC